MIFFCHVWVKIALPVSVLAFSTHAIRYLHFPYLHFQSPPPQSVSCQYISKTVSRHSRSEMVHSSSVAIVDRYVAVLYVVEN